MSARLSAFDGGVGPAVETTALDVVDGRTLGRCVHPPTYAVGWAQGEVLAISSRLVSPVDRVGTHLAELASLHRDDIRGGADS
ncbi:MULTISPECIES: hypothetical protein [Rhodococcus]|jgi:hypothetical protein|uniref:hypothetical protein n=1 Tax=Rhodococcus TaxID=1827 RepID=UPI000F738245|nr:MULTISPECIES: hypothetical protein [Rhodococcus]MBY6382469.1 hypothetical protein [Rhodococcus erythropolis]